MQGRFCMEGDSTIHKWEYESQVKDVGIGKLTLLTAFYSCVTGTSSWSSPLLKRL